MILTAILFLIFETFFILIGGVIVAFGVLFLYLKKEVDALIVVLNVEISYMRHMGDIVNLQAFFVKNFLTRKPLVLHALIAE